jgi:hypothetical protein
MRTFIHSASDGQATDHKRRDYHYIVYPAASPFFVIFNFNFIEDNNACRPEGSCKWDLFAFLKSTGVCNDGSLSVLSLSSLSWQLFRILVCLCVSSS